MMTITLSATNALLDLMPVRTEPRKTPSGEAVPLSLRLLPRALRDAMVRRSRQRELEQAFARLAETSAHLLADVGMIPATGAEAAPRMTWTRALPAPEAGALDGPSGLAAPSRSRSRRRLLELDDRLLSDVGISRAQARQEARKPAWNGPDHWLR